MPKEIRTYTFHIIIQTDQSIKLLQSDIFLANPKYKRNTTNITFFKKVDYYWFGRKSFSGITIVGWIYSLKD